MLNLILVFILLYGPKFGMFGFDFISFACIVTLIIHHKHIGKAIYTMPIFLGALTTVYVLAVLLLNGVTDWWWIWRMPRYLLNVGACFVLVYAMNIRGRGVDLLAYIFFAAVIHSSIVIAQLFSADVNSFLIGILDNYQESDIRYSGLVRGLTPPSFVMATSIGIGYYCYIKDRIGWQLLLIGATIIFFACLVMGRAGLYLGFMTSILLIGYIELYERRLAKTLILASTVFTACVILVIFIDDLPTDPLIISSFKYGLEPFYNYIHIGELYSSSIQDFQQHGFIFHNNTFTQYIFGTGLYGRGDASTHLPTDIAYAHMFSAFGLLGIILITGSVASMLHVKKTITKSYRFLFALMFFSTVCVFILNYKETTLLTRHITSLLAFLWSTMHFMGSYHASPSPKK